MANFFHVSVDYFEGNSWNQFVRAGQETVGDLLSKIDKISDADISIDRILAGKTPVKTEAAITPSSTPVEVLCSFGSKYIFADISKKRTEQSDSTKNNAFDILLTAQRSYTYLPSERSPVNNAKDRLYNDVLSMMKRNNIGFTPIQLESTGAEIVRTLTNALWYIDPHLEKLAQRGVVIPETFRQFKDYYDWKTQKKKTPMISACDLRLHINALSDLLMKPWFLIDQFSGFRTNCDELLKGLETYLKHITKQAERTAAHHASKEPVRSISDSWSMRLIDTDHDIKPAYSQLKIHMEQINMYEPVFLNEFEPSDRMDRRTWLKNLALPFPVKLYTHYHGNYFGNFNFVWKIPEDTSERGDGDLNAISSIKVNFDTYSTRAIRKSFTLRYAKSSIQPAILRDIFRFLTNDSAAAESTQESQIDDRVAQFLLDADDTDLFYDLRKLNGRPQDSSLNPFWEELGKYLDEVSVVHERRHASHTYMPLATSVQALIDQVGKRLPQGASLPSVSWVRLNFWPSNAYTRAAMCYTGRFAVKFAVQQRLLRARHPDSSFAFYQFILLKHFAVKMRDSAMMICLDDKSVVPVGEPDAYVSTGVRPHHKAMVPVGATIVALDHDFHIHGVVPSVLLHTEIPTDTKDSFHHGTIHVSVKDKVFEPSSAMRHAAETAEILRQSSPDGLSMDKPVLFMYTDGGPDHRSTFWTVQLAYIALFIALDLDMLISARTAPSQSYNNPAERCMSLLNLALQHTSFARDKMTDSNEFKVKSCSTMKKLRELAKRQPFVKEALTESMEPVISNMKQRFSQLKCRGENVVTHDAATSDSIKQIAAIFDIFREDDDPLTSPVIQQLSVRKQLSKFPKLVNFIEKHCRCRHYTFQLKKCGDINCWYCVLNPPRLIDDTFEGLHWLPDPVMDPASKEYRCFDDVYGTDTTDEDRPILKQNVSTPTENDKTHKGDLVAAKARAVVHCAECGKPRVVYAKNRLNIDHIRQLDRLQEELTYTCGSQLFPPENKLVDVLFVREAISCSCPMETTYYAGITVTFPDVCFFCGDMEDLSSGDLVQDLRKQYAIVRPVCDSCLHAGKTPAVRNALKVNQKKKK